jgi:hypothetical protein
MTAPAGFVWASTGSDEGCVAEPRESPFHEAV